MRKCEICETNTAKHQTTIKFDVKNVCDECLPITPVPPQNKDRLAEGEDKSALKSSYSGKFFTEEQTAILRKARGE